MKASELIVALQDTMKEHGDLSVAVDWDDNDGDSMLYVGGTRKTDKREWTGKTEIKRTPCKESPGFRLSRQSIYTKEAVIELTLEE